MARRTIRRGAGNWNDTNSWEEGQVPTMNDAVVAIRGSGPLTVNVSDAVCASLDLSSYYGEFIFGEESQLVVTHNINLLTGSGLVFNNPVDTLVLNGDLISLSADEDAQILKIDPGTGIPYIIPYV